tara:strand:+ start:29905 stop:30489 length:585 start_codon:yes stop_codon:yes gene_type:complete
MEPQMDRAEDNIAADDNIAAEDIDDVDAEEVEDTKLFLKCMDGELETTTLTFNKCKEDNVDPLQFTVAIMRLVLEYYSLPEPPTKFDCYTLEPYHLEFCDRIFGDREVFYNEVMRRGEKYLPDVLKISPEDKSVIQSLLTPYELVMNQCAHLYRMSDTLTQYYAWYIVHQFAPPYLRLLPIEKILEHEDSDSSE